MDLCEKVIRKFPNKEKLSRDEFLEAWDTDLELTLWLQEILDSHITEDDIKKYEDPDAPENKKADDFPQAFQQAIQEKAYDIFVVDGIESIRNYCDI